MTRTDDTRHNLSPYLFFSLFLLLLNSKRLYCYRGVYRFANGTDVELYKLNNGVCEKVVHGEIRNDPVENYCGYECNRVLNKTSSVYKLQRGTLSGCEKDFEIIPSENCSVAIGTNWRKDEVNAIEVKNINKQILYYGNTKASRCTLKNKCSVKYRNFTSGWQAFSYGDCFQFKVVDDNSKAVAQIRIDCVQAHQEYLAGQMFRIELECHMDIENKTFDACLLLKIPGLFKGDESLLSSEACATPLPPVIPTTADPLKSDDDFMEPYGWIIIGVVLTLILLAAIVCIYIYCSRKKRYSVDSKSESQGDHLGITVTASPEDPDPTVLHQSYKHKTTSMNSNVVLVPGNSGGDNPSFEMDDDVELPDPIDSNWNIPTENPYEDPDKFVKFNPGPISGDINCTVNGTLDRIDKHEENSIKLNGHKNRHNNTSDDDVGDDDGYWDRNSETPILERRNNSLLRDEVLDHFGLDETGNYKLDGYSSCDDEQEAAEDPYKVTNLLENSPRRSERDNSRNSHLPLGRKQSGQKINFHDDNVMF